MIPIGQNPHFPYGFDLGVPSPAEISINNSYCGDAQSDVQRNENTVCTVSTIPMTRYQMFEEVKKS